MDRQEFNDALKLAGLSKKEFAEECGIEYGTVNNWGNEGRGVPYWVKPFLECKAKSNAYDRVRDEVLKIEGITVS